MSELTHHFNFKWPVFRKQISSKHAHDTSASRSFLCAINAQIFPKVSPHLAPMPLIILHTKISPISKNCKKPIFVLLNKIARLTGGHFVRKQLAASYRHALRQNSITQKANCSVESPVILRRQSTNHTTDPTIQFFQPNSSV